MRLSTAVCISLLSCGCIARAQQPPLPSPEMPKDAAPAETPLPAPTVPQLIPDDVLRATAPTPIAPNLQQLDEAFQDKPISAAAADHRNRIEWRRLRNIVSNEANIRAALAEAEAAKTDLQKRKLLGRYYEMFYGRMLALAKTPEMKAYLTARKNEEQNILRQPHVRPDPKPTATPTPVQAPTPTPPTPSPAAGESPAPQGLPTPLPGTGSGQPRD